MKYKIEKNIPMIGITNYPFKDMEVGDSFTVPTKERNKVRCACKLTSIQKLGMNFKTRTVDKNTVRVWRIA